MAEFENYVQDEQDPKVVEKVFGKLTALLTSGETIQYIAVQKKPVANITPDSIVLTNKRIIICKPKNLGLTMEFIEYFWKDVKNCQMKEELFGASFTIILLNNELYPIDFIPKIQARRLYKIAQEQEELHRELIRERDLEEKRASAGSVYMTPAPPIQENITPISKQVQELEAEQPNIEPKPDEIMNSLQKLKTLFEAGLLTQEEFENKKADILSRF
ncbi:MAG: PH domain-containing protein [bacterium]